MAKYLVPNTPDAAHIDIAEPDAGDFVALGYRATGILSGGTVSALGTPAMAVAVAAATVIINGVPFSYTGTNKTIQASSGSPRFDIVGWDANGAAVITGTSGANPEFPDFDPATFCPGAIVYVTAGAISITEQYVTSKGPTMEPTFRRVYAGADDIMVRGTVGVSNYTISAGGKHTWGNSVLSKLSESVMDWVTNLKIRAADTAQSVLTLTGRAADPNGHAVLDIRDANGVQVAYINGVGDFYANNFKTGNVPPEGVVNAARGALYTNYAATDGNILYVKMTNTGNTGWAVHRAYDPTAGAVTPGSLVPWIGASGASIPTGYLKPMGQTNLSTTNYANLHAVTGYRFGGSGSTFGLPDLRGKTVFGDAGVTGFTAGSEQGNAGGVVSLNVLHMPNHSHNVIDPGHYHEQGGPYWYYRPSAYHNNRHPFPSTSMTLEHLYVDHNTARVAHTGIAIESNGAGQPFSILPPVHIVQWLVKT